MNNLLKALCVFERELGMVFGRESGTVFTENNSLSLTVKT